MKLQEDKLSPPVYEDTDKVEQDSDSTRDETKECEDKTKKDKELANHFRNNIENLLSLNNDDPCIVRYFIHQ